jgi:hypothetical protein
MDIGHQGDIYLFFDLTQGVGGFFVGNGATDDLAAGGFELMYLRDGGRDIGRVGFGHGLHGRRPATADFYIPDLNFLG